MTTGNVQSSWQQINGNYVLVLRRSTGELVSLTIDQVNQVLQPMVSQNGSNVYLVNITDAVTPEQKQIVYKTQNPVFTTNALHITAAEFDSILASGKQMLQHRTAQTAALTNTMSANQGINVASTLNSAANITQTGATSVNKLTTGSNQIIRGVDKIDGATTISGYSSGLGNIASGVGAFAGITALGSNTNGNPATATESDDRNFFLSIGNWLDKSLFGSIADLMPFDLLKKAVKMIGGTLSGLFKTIGYIIEGDWDKVKTVGFEWLKDVAITAALGYGAYYLGKELNLFGNDDENITDSISDVISNSSSNTVVQTTTTTTQSLALNHRPSSSSTPVATLDQAGKVITNGNDRYFATGSILNNGNSSPVFELTSNQKTDTK